MTNKINSIYLYVILTFVVIGIVWLSYFNAKSTAESLVGTSIEYAQLSTIKVGIIDGKRIVWIFRFSNSTVLDAEFDIYVSVLGELLQTNPTDLERRLRGMEKRETHPYSEKGIRERYGHEINGVRLD